MWAGNRGCKDCENGQILMFMVWRIMLPFKMCLIRNRPVASNSSFIFFKINHLLSYQYTNCVEYITIILSNVEIPAANPAKIVKVHQSTIDDICVEKLDHAVAITGQVIVSYKIDRTMRERSFGRFTTCNKLNK